MNNMGGEIEDILTKFAIWIGEKIPALAPIKDKGERIIFASHVGWHWIFGLAFCLVGALWIKWIAFACIPLFLFVWIAEKNDKRLIDWISRGLGWFLGVLTMIPVLIWG